MRIYEIKKLLKRPECQIYEIIVINNLRSVVFQPVLRSSHQVNRKIIIWPLNYILTCLEIFLLDEKTQLSFALWAEDYIRCKPPPKKKILCIEVFVRWIENITFWSLHWDHQVNRKYYILTFALGSSGEQKVLHFDLCIWGHQVNRKYYILTFALGSSGE